VLLLVLYPNKAALLMQKSGSGGGMKARA
jgi:hypothetical protein